MLNERLQILVRPDQRRRLEAEAKRRETSVAALIREAVDEKFAAPSVVERVAAVERMRARAGGMYFPPEQLSALIDQGRLEEALQRLDADR